MRILALLLMSFLFRNYLPAQEILPEVSYGKRTAVTGDLRDWIPDTSSPFLKINTRDEKGLIFARDLQRVTFTNYGSRHSGPDPVWQKGFTPPKQGTAVNTPASVHGTATSPVPGASVIGQDFDGISANNVAPADPTLAIGPNHIIQMVNGASGSSYFQIFDKQGGAIRLQAFMDQLPGTAYNGGGDCITWYDQLEQRFVMSEFGDSSQTGRNIQSLIIAVSQTPDPLGSWYVYEFSDTSFFPDYPKYANWHDAWYGVTADFKSSYLGNSIWAFNKKKMLAGNPVAEVIRYRLTHPEFRYYSTAPVGLAGNQAAASDSPGLFLYLHDDSWTRDPSDVDSIGIISFRPDFINPSQSFIRFEKSFAVAPYKSDVCNSRDCAPSPKGVGYDVIDSRFMNKPLYRNFGSHQSIVANHTVDVSGSTLAGLRWYELRNNNTGWGVRQQGSFAPQNESDCAHVPALYRFMGAVAMNGKGQIAIGYNNSSIERYASIAISGRNAEDPENLMSYREKDALIGQHYGTFQNRWGDYNEILTDPSNDSIFWFTSMYGGSDNRFKTRILSFKLTEAYALDASLEEIEYPNNCQPFCSPTVQPRVRIRNNGSQTLRQAVIRMRIGSQDIIQSQWNGSLQVSEETVVVLPLVLLPSATATLRAWITEPNGGVDGQPSNDTARLQWQSRSPAGTPFGEGFEGTAFPPAGWSQSVSGSTNIRWYRDTKASHSGSASVKCNNYGKNERGKWSDLQTPLTDLSDADSATLSFRLAAAVYSATVTDTLEVWVSSDCGNSFERVWRKWGLGLSTIPAYRTDAFTPVAGQWRQELVSLKRFAGRSGVIVRFRNINNYSNNIHLDDINISSIPAASRDAGILSIDAPGAILCSTETAPAVTITNAAKDTLRSVRVGYRIDGGPVRSVIWTGRMAPKQSASVVLPASNIAPGYRRLEAFTTDPNGGPDERPGNDTLRLMVGVKSPQPLPVTEGFEGMIFPPMHWSDVNPDRLKGWERSNDASHSGTGSLVFKNHRDTATGQSDAFVSPLMVRTDADSVFLEFSVAAAPNLLPGNQQIADTLEVRITTNCGQTYWPVYKKWGAALKTADPQVDNGQQTLAFIPSAGDWRRERVNLTPLLGNVESFIVSFRNISHGDNDIYMDDISVYSKTVPEKLKQRGYQIAPNPFRDRISIQFYPSAASLLGVEIFNAKGQSVYTRRYADGKPPAVLEIDLRGLPAGVYPLRIHYTDRTVVEQLVKQ